MDTGQILGHLPMEISRATKFLLDRAIEVKAEVSANYYRRSPLVQGGLEIPCKLLVRIQVPTVKNIELKEKFKSIMQELYAEPIEDIIMDSLLFDDPNETEIDMQIAKLSPAVTNKKKRKTCEKTAPTETNISQQSSADIRNFFTQISTVKSTVTKNKKGNVIVIDD